MLLARIDAVNPALNSVIELRREAALQEAGAADQAIAGGVRKPLHGVPMTIKESFNVAGMHTTWGNPAFMDYMADSDATVVRRLKQAGAIIVGKTNVHFMLADFGQAVRCHQQSLGYDTHPGRLHRWSGCSGLCRDDVPRIRLGPKTTPLSRSPTSSVTSSVGTSPRRSDESEGRVEGWRGVSTTSSASQEDALGCRLPDWPGGGGSPVPQRREVGEKPIGLDLEERLGLVEARQAI